MPPRCAWLRAAGRSKVWLAAAQQREDEEHEEDEEEDLGDRGRGAGDDAKAEYAGQDGDEEKDDGIVEHGGGAWDYRELRARPVKPMAAQTVPPIRSHIVRSVGEPVKKREKLELT